MAEIDEQDQWLRALEIIKRQREAREKQQLWQQARKKAEQLMRDRASIRSLMRRD